MATLPLQDSERKYRRMRLRSGKPLFVPRKLVGYTSCEVEAEFDLRMAIVSEARHELRQAAASAAAMKIV